MLKTSPNSLVMCLTMLLAGSAWGQAPAPKLGVRVAQTAEFSAYSLQAEATGGGARCTSSWAGAAAAPDAAEQARINEQLAREQMQARHAILQRYIPLQTPQQEAMNEAIQLQRAGRIDPAELKARVERAQAELERLRRASQAEEDALEREFTGKRLIAARQLLLSLLHAPSNPGATIIPLSNYQPSPAFVAELNRSLAGFLATCPDLPAVYVQHDWAAMPVSKHPVITGEYALRAGVLELRPALLKDKRSVLLRDPAQNPRLTLAGLQTEHQAAVHKRQELADWQGATYRKDFESAAMRAPGIVYKGDAFWAPFPRLEMVRRVFDGDFKGSAGSTGFKALFNSHAEFFSGQCKAQVKEFVRYLMPNREVVRTRTYASGRVENDYVDRPIPIFIDKRFTPQYAEYQSSQATAHLAETTRAMKEHGNPLLWKQGEFGKRMAAGLADNALLQHMAFLRDLPCTGATMSQLTENMLRAAQGRPSAQAEALRFEGAQAESEKPTRP